MGWLIESLANAFLEILGDLMSIATTLVVGLNLDVGMISSDAISNLGNNASVSTVVPALGSIINPVNANGLIDQIFPDIRQFCPIISFMAYMLVFFLCITKLIIAMGGPFTKSEEPGVIAVRTLIAGGGVALSYSIFVMIETLFNGFYNAFMAKYRTITSGASNYTLLLNPSPEADGMTREERISQYSNGTVTNSDDAFNMLSKDLIESYEGDGLALSILEIALFTILLIAFFKLLLEIFERYVVLGALFYFSPLAFATIVSKKSGVFENYIIMVISEFIVMMSNLFFTGIFISAWYKILNTENHALFPDPKAFIITMLLMIAWLTLGQRFDQHLKGLGLATAQTGAGLGAQVMAGASGVMAMGALAKSVATGGYKAVTGQTNLQRGIRAGDEGGMVGRLANGMKAFPSISQTNANNRLAAWNDKTSTAAKALSKMDPETRGHALMNTVTSSMGGEKNLQSALRNQTGKSNLGAIDYKSIKFENGQLTGNFKGAKEGEKGPSFMLQHDSLGGNKGDFKSEALTGGWSAPVTKERANALGVQEAKSISGTYDNIDGKTREIKASYNNGHLTARYEDANGHMQTVRELSRDVTSFNNNGNYWNT